MRRQVDRDEEGGREYSQRDLRKVAADLLRPSKTMMFVVIIAFLCVLPMIFYLAYNLSVQEDMMMKMARIMWSAEDGVPKECFVGDVAKGTCIKDSDCPRFRAPEGLLITYSCVIDMCFAHLEVRREGVWPGMPQTLCEALVDVGDLQPCVRVTPIVEGDTLMGCGVSFKSVAANKASQVHGDRFGSLSPTLGQEEE